MELPITFFLALSLSVLLTYKVRSWAVRLGIVDLPDTVRRFHSRPTPRAGGVGIFVSFALVVALAWARGHIDLGGDEMFARQFLALTLGGAMIFGLGLADDASGGLRARTKFAIQATIAVAVFMLGVRIEGFALPGGFFELPTAFSLLLTVFWIVGVTNAFNLIDGSDGVAGGAAVFAAAAMAAVSLLNGNELGAIVAITLAGATIGFLVFNFPPASIFLGDSGSLFLGFTLATLGVITTQTAQTALAVAIPVVSCGLPILDTLLAMARRALRGESLFTPDRGHIHHRLRDLGHSPRRVALILYAASAAFALLSLLLIQPSGRPVAALFILAGAVVWIAVQRLRIPELVEVGRILGRGARQREAIAHNVRIRDAVERVRGAVTPERIFEALRESFEAGEFDRGEMWLPARFAAALVGPKTGVVPDGEGCRWSWRREVAPPPEHLCEFRIPFRDPNGQSVGRMSLWYDLTRDGRPLTDLRLIAEQLQPVLWSAIMRLEDDGATETRGEDEAETDHEHVVTVVR